jgi:hypothetical protein
MLSQYGAGAVPSYTPSDLRIMKAARRIAENAWRLATPAERETLEVKPFTRWHDLGVKVTTPDARAMFEAAYAEHLRSLRFGRIALRPSRVRGGKRRHAGSATQLERLTTDVNRLTR